MTAPVFVDTNVLVYARDAAAGEKQAAAQSEDFQDGQDLGGIRVVNPFTLAPTRLDR